MTNDQGATRARFRDNFTRGERSMFWWGVAAGMAGMLAITLLGRALA